MKRGTRRRPKRGRRGSTTSSPTEPSSFRNRKRGGSRSLLRFAHGLCSRRRLLAAAAQALRRQGEEDHQRPDLETESGPRETEEPGWHAAKGNPVDPRWGEGALRVSGQVGQVVGIERVVARDHQRRGGNWEECCRNAASIANRKHDGDGHAREESDQRPRHHEALEPSVFTRLRPDGDPFEGNCSLVSCGTEEHEQHNELEESEASHRLLPRLWCNDQCYALYLMFAI